jgi:hypothetical protein
MPSPTFLHSSLDGVGDVVGIGVRHAARSSVLEELRTADLLIDANRETKMEPTSSAIGLIVIVVLYIGIGAMSAAGSLYISKSIFSAKAEQIFFGLFLIPIAGFCLAFTAYFGDKDAWQLEATAAVMFAVLGLVGVRVPFALIVGHPLHGLWDSVHEFNLLPGQTTSVPLAYGFFCVT